MLATLSTVVVLAGIVYEDFRLRRVRIVYFFALLPLLYFQSNISGLDHWRNIAINVIYLMLIALSAALYSLYKSGTIRAISSYIGLGDFLFLLSLAVSLHPILMIIFNSASYLAALIVHTLLSRFSFYSKFNSIPLAGIQGICFLPVFLYIGHIDTAWMNEFYN